MVAVVVLALAGTALALWLSADEVEFNDRAGVVADWRVEMPASPYPLAPEPGDIAVVHDSPRTFRVFWWANPCSDHPLISTRGSPRDLLVRVAPRHAGCDDIGVLWQLTATTKADLGQDSITVELVGPS